jgi:hypothetical protein
MQAAWQMASSSSVVMPGSMAAAVWASTSAAARPAMRMRSMISGDFTAGSGRRTAWPDSAYGGRGISGGTGRVGLMRPGRMRSVAALWQRLNFLPLPHQQGSLALRTPWAWVTVTTEGYRLGHRVTMCG